MATALAGVGVIVAFGAPHAGAEPPPGSHSEDIRDYPLAQGNYSTSTDFYQVYFRTPDGRSCGIGPNGGPVGCDAVPSDAPPGTNQTVVNSWGPAEYRHSDTASFTRDVDVLPEGYRLQNWGASCAVEEGGAVRCETYGDHGFFITGSDGELW